MTRGPADPTTQAPTSTGTEERILTPLFALITGGSLLYFVGLGILLPVLPRYVEEHLGGGGFEVGLVVGSFAVTAAAVRPFVGQLGDRVGRRTMAVGGALVAAASIGPLAAVEALWFMVALRLVTGLGEAGFFVGSATAAQDLVPDHRRGEAASFYSIAVYGGLGGGPVLGELVYRDLGPAWAFAVAGLLTAAGALVSTAIPGDLGRSAAPAARRGLLHPAAIAPGTVLLLGLVAFSGFSAFVPLYVDEVGIDDAGPFFASYGAIVLVIRIVGARLPDVLGAVRASAIALTAIALGVGAIAVWQSVVALWFGTFWLAVGMALLFPALFSLAVNGAPAAERSHAVGTFSLFFDLSQGVGAPLLGLAVTVFGTERAAFFVGAAVAAAGAVGARVLLAKGAARLATT